MSAKSWLAGAWRRVQPHGTQVKAKRQAFCSGSAFALCWAGLMAPVSAQTVVVLDSEAASITLIDRASQQVIDTFTVGKEPHHLMATPDNSSLIVANSVSDNLVVLDPKTGRIQRRVESIEDPYQIGFSPDKKWFVSASLRLDRVDIYRYDGHNLSLVKRLPLAAMPSHIAFTRDSRIAFITLQVSGEVAAIDLLTQSVLWKMPVGKVPAGMWMTPNDQYILVGITGADYVAVVDWRRRQVVKTIPTGRGAHNFRSLVDGRHVAVTNRVQNSISIIDEFDLVKVGDITGLLPGPDDMELSADRKQLWVTFRFAKRVGVIDLPSCKLVNTIAVGRSPHGIYFFDRAPWTSPNGA